MRLLPTKEMIAQSWQKYGLIVVGNIVFFVLLYFISYRPNNDEHRAAELLSMAQEQESRANVEAAAVLYGKVLERYPGTDASRAAGTLIPELRRRLAAKARAGGAPGAQPCIDVASVLAKKPSLFVAAYLAERYGEDPASKPKARRAIADYLGAAMRIDGVALADIRRERALRSPELEQELFTVRPACVMTPDLVYDDFSVRNDNFFPWTDVEIRIDVRQGEGSVSEKVRVGAVAPGSVLDLAEHRVKKGGGVVTCAVRVKAAEGAGAWSGPM
jgi:hypothetical protein